MTAMYDNFEDFFHSVVMLFYQHFSPDLVTLWDFSYCSNMLVLLDSYPHRTNLKGGRVVPADSSLTGIAVEKKEPVILDGLEKDHFGRTFQNPEVVTEIGLQWMLSLPILEVNLSKKDNLEKKISLIVNLYFKDLRRKKSPIRKDELNRLLCSIQQSKELLLHKKYNKIRKIVSRSLSKTRGIADIFKSIHPKLLFFLKSKHASIYSYDSTNNQLFCERTTEKKKNSIISSTTHLPGNSHVETDSRYSSVFESCISENTPFVGKSSFNYSDEIPKIFSTYIAVPISSSDSDVIGVLECWQPHEEGFASRSYSTIDVQLLNCFANYISPYFEKYINLRNNSNLLKAVTEVQTSIENSDNLNVMLQSAIERIVDVLDVQVGSIYLLDNHKNKLEMSAAAGPNKNLINEANYEIGHGLTGWIAETGQVLCINNEKDIKSHPKYIGKYDNLIWKDTDRISNTFLGVPIKFGDEVLGVWKVSSIKRHDKQVGGPFYTDEDIHAAKVISSLLGLIIKKYKIEDAELYKLRHLAENSIEIEKAEIEADAIESVLIGLSEIGYNTTLLCLLEKNKNSINGVLSSGAGWERIEDFVILPHDNKNLISNALTENKAKHIKNLSKLIDDRVKKFADYDIDNLYILPLKIGQEELGVLIVDLEKRVTILPTEELVLKAFAGHLAIALSRIKNFHLAVGMSEKLMSNSRFVVAETLSSMAIHSTRHRLSDILDELSQQLKDRDIRSNRFVLENLNKWQIGIKQLKEELEEALRFVKAENKSEAETLDLYELIQGSIDTWINYIQNNRCRIEKKLKADRLLCKISKNSFQEIMSVLIVNSIQAFSRKIEITVYNEDNFQISEGFNIDNVVIIEFVDDGNGIVVNDSERLFDNDYTTKKGKDGTGLGLFIARELANKFGGEIMYSSHPKTKKRGACFKVIFPTES